MNFNEDSRRCHGSGAVDEASAESSYMCRARAAIATTSLVVVADIEKGLPGNDTIVGSRERSPK